MSWINSIQSIGFLRCGDRDETSYADVIETAINRALIPVSAELGKSSLTVMDFINLQVGDVIKLNRKVEDELDIYVGNIVKFKALPGSFNDDYAVKITEIIREEE